MPRPRKRRVVCALPQSADFAPLDYSEKSGSVLMSVDEYEAIRLIDYEGLTQEECAEQMSVARTTVQAIYDSARKKLALVLVDSKRLIIGGGDYRFCDGSGRHCKGNCRRNGNN